MRKLFPLARNRRIVARRVVIIEQRIASSRGEVVVYVRSRFQSGRRSVGRGRRRPGIAVATRVHTLADRSTSSLSPRHSIFGTSSSPLRRHLSSRIPFGEAMQWGEFSCPLAAGRTGVLSRRQMVKGSVSGSGLSDEGTSHRP